MIKVTEEMVTDAINKVGQGSSMIYIPTRIRHEMAGVITALADPKSISYEVEFEDSELEEIVSSHSEVIEVIENGATEHKFVYITVQHGNTDDPDSLAVIGYVRCIYKRNDVFLHVVREDGAGIGLAKVLNDIVAKTAKTQKGQ
jgi:hypothetical protein